MLRVTVLVLRLLELCITAKLFHEHLITPSLSEAQLIIIQPGLCSLPKPLLVCTKIACLVNIVLTRDLTEYENLILNEEIMHPKPIMDRKCTSGR